MIKEKIDFLNNGVMFAVTTLGSLLSVPQGPLICIVHVDAL